MNPWTQTLKPLYDRSVERYAAGDREWAGWFDRGERAFLDSIGARPIYLFDYAEDYVGGGEPDWETALLMLAIRRERFLFRQGGRWPDRVLEASELPPKSAAVEGIEWLPRILVKARAFLDGVDTPGIMFCCGGDRAFLRRHALHPADFLRAVAGADGDDRAVIEFVRRGGAGG